MPDQSLYSDEDLFIRIASDDHAAYGQLLDRYEAVIYGQAMAYLKDSYKAQDIVQEVFLAIWHTRENLSAVENPAAYIFIIARNKIMSEFRKKVVLPLEKSVEQLTEDADKGADIRLQQKQTLSLIQSVIDKMPPQRKAVFELTKKEGLKYEEIAKRLGISKNTVKVHMVQALSFIRDHLRDMTILFVIIFF